MARGIKRTEAEIDTWLRAIEPLMKDGLKLKVACDKLEIPYTTIKTYAEKDISVRTRLDCFEASFEVDLTGVVMTEARKNPELAFKVLERLRKKDWSSRQEVTGADGEAVDVNLDLTKLTKKEIDELEKITDKASD